MHKNPRQTCTHNFQRRNFNILPLFTKMYIQIYGGDIEKKMRIKSGGGRGGGKQARSRVNCAPTWHQPRRFATVSKIRERALLRTSLMRLSSGWPQLGGSSYTPMALRREAWEEKRGRRPDPWWKGLVLVRIENEPHKFEAGSTVWK